MLSERLAAVADTQEASMRKRMHAALRIGAELALARIDEVGGKYATGSDIRSVRDELDAEGIAYEDDTPPVLVKTLQPFAETPETPETPEGPQF